MSKPGSSLSDKVAVVILSRTATTAIDTVTGIALLHLLSQESFGVLALLLLVYEVAKQIATLGFPESVFYFFERLGRGTRRGFAIQTFGIMFATALFSALVIFGLTFVTPWWLDDWSPVARAAVAEYLPVMALVALFELPTWPVQNILLALDRQRHAALYQFVTSLATLGCLVGPLAAGYGLNAAVWALLGYAIVRFVGSTVLMTALLPRERAPLPAGTLADQVRFSIPLGLHTLASRLNKYADKLIVSIFLTEELLAQYQAATYEIPFITAIPYAMGSVLISRYVALHAAGEGDRLLALWHRGIRKVSLAVVPAVVLAIAVAPDLVILATGSEAYAEAVIPFQLFSFLMLQRVAQYGAMLQAVGDTRGILRITVFMLAFNVVLSVPLTLAAGIVGTAAATVVASLAGWWLYVRVIARHLGIGVGKVMPWRHYGRVLGLATLAGILTWLARTHAFPQLDRLDGLLASTALFMLAYFGAAAVTGTVERDDWRSLAILLRIRRG